MKLKNSIKIGIFLCLCALFSFNMMAQAPKKMSFQAVIRDANNIILGGKPIGMKISILKDSPSGVAVYAETQTLTTNTNGLVTLEIGSGTVQSGNFANIDWSTGSYFVKTETDPGGGSNYSITGVSQLLSVPYAMYAAGSGSSTPGPQGPTGPQGAKGDTGAPGPPGLANGSAAGNTTYWNGTKWVTDNSNISNNGANVGIGTTTPKEKLEVNGNIRVADDADLLGVDQIVGFNDLRLYGSKDRVTPGAEADVRVMDNGFVGINTPFPQRRLHVNGSSKIDSTSFANRFEAASMRIEDVQGSFWIHANFTPRANKTVLLGTFHGKTNGSQLRFESDANGFADIGLNGAGDFVIENFDQETFVLTQAGNVGVGTATPARKLHVSDVMRLEPRSAAPTSPGKGDMYFDGTLNKLRVFDGTVWQNCW